MKPISIDYTFQMRNGSSENFRLQVDRRSLQIIQTTPKHLPRWTALDHARCANCSLDSRMVTRCPAAVCMTGRIGRFARLLSSGAALVRVQTPERLISNRTGARKGIASLMGLLMAVSGCPRTAFMRPLARFHLPFGGHRESTWQSVSAYLLIQYFKQHDGQAVDTELSGLVQLHSELRAVGHGFADRLRSACRNTVIPELVVKFLAFAADNVFEDIRGAFGPYLKWHSADVQPAEVSSLHRHR